MAAIVNLQRRVARERLEADVARGIATHTCNGAKKDRMAQFTVVDRRRDIPWVIKLL